MRSAQLAVAAWLAIAAPLVAIEKDDDVIVTSFPSTKADSEGVTFGYGKLLWVHAVDGERLRVTAGGKVGHVTTNEVIPRNEAVEYFTKRIEVTPTVVEFTARGRMRYYNDRLDEALADIGRALELDPGYVPALTVRSDVRVSKGDYAKALEDAECAVELAPDDEDAIFTRAIAFTFTRQSNEAMEEYRKLVRLHPKNYAAHNNLGKHLIDQWQWDEALVELNEAIRIYPEYSDAFTNRGIIHHRRKQLDLAIQDATSAIRFNEKNPSAWNNRANAYIELKRFDDAERDFRELIRLSPDRVEGHHGLANTFFLADKLDEALIEIDAVLKINPDDFKACNTRGNVLKSQKKFSESIATFDRAVAAMLRQAAIYDSPQWENVERLFNGEKLLTIDVADFPNRLTLATITVNRADAFRQLAEKEPTAKEKMFADFDRAITLFPENDAYRLGRGQQRFKDGEYQRAIDDFDDILYAKPDDVQALNGRMRAYLELKQLDRALRDAERLKKLGHPIDAATLKQLEIE